MATQLIGGPVEASAEERIPVVTVTAAAHDPKLMNRPIAVCGYLISTKGWRKVQVLEANGSFLLVERLPGEVANKAFASAG